MKWVLPILAAAAVPGMMVRPLWVLGALGALLGALLLVLLPGRGPSAISGRSVEHRAAEDEPTPEALVGPASIHQGLGRWIGLAVLIRLAVAILVNESSLWLSFGPDAHGWEHLGRTTYLYWTGQARLPSWYETPNSQTFYATLNGLSWTIFGASRIPLSMLNAVVGVGCAWSLGMVGRALFDVRVGRRVFLLALYFPSLVLWHSMNLREVWAHAALAIFVLAAHNVRERISAASLGLLLGALITIIVIRSYLAPVVVAAFGIAALATRPGQLPYAMVALACVGGFVGRFGSVLGIDMAVFSTESLETIQNLREGLAYGGSAYGDDVDTRTVTGALSYLPEGMARFLFSPFPWAIQSWQQALAAPEALVWFGIFCQGSWFIARNTTRNILRWMVPIVLMALLTAAYGLVSGNEGTAFRHRSQVMILMFLFAAAAQVGFGSRSSPRISARPPLGAPTSIGATG